MRYVLLISYDGTDFSGWQKQKGSRTVQEVLEEAAEKIFGEKLKITASGRTDAGVHALGQVAQMDAETTIPPEKIAICLNRLLPPDVKVLRSAPATLGFDCTRQARKKTYRYLAYHFPQRVPLFERHFAYLERRPDIESMKEAGRLLVGRHDFAAFRSAGFTSKTSEREIYRLEISSKMIDGVEIFEVEVTGNGFLYNMVRIICGELFAVGCGKHEKISEALKTGDRAVLGKTMPPQGLCLVNVDFEVPLFGGEI